MMKKTVVSVMMIVFFLWLHTTAHAEDLAAAVAIIPPHSIMGDDGNPTGGFVEIVNAIDSVYEAGHIAIQLYPMARALNMLKTGRVDFFIPYIPPPHLSEKEFSYTSASEPIVPVAFVLYSKSDGPVPNMDRLEDYWIETLRGEEDHFSFKINGIDSFRQGLMKVIAKRSDGFIVEQDAADKYIRTHRLKNIRRTLYATWNSSIMIPKGDRGRKIDRIISTALRKLKESGELQKITATIHKPYEEWQPYHMKW